jgi:sirohydrochlorin cobaltochelatase
MKRLRHYDKGTAIVLSCFGSVVEQQRYLKLQQRITELYPHCEVKIAFTSKMVIKKLALEDEHYQNLPQVLADLDMAGFKRILVVSCYLYPTDEHLQMCNMVEGFRHFSLANIEYTPAIMHHISHTNRILAALHQRFADDSDVNLFINHGAPWIDNSGHQAIHYCDSLLHRLSAHNFTCSLEGAWPFHLMADSLQQKMLQVAADIPQPRLRLIPMLLVSGNHFDNDLAEIKQQLEPAFEVAVASPIQGEKFCLFDVPEITAVIEQQIAEGLIRVQATELEVQCG